MATTFEQWATKRGQVYWLTTSVVKKDGEYIAPGCSQDHYSFVDGRDYARKHGLILYQVETAVNPMNHRIQSRVLARIGV